MILKKILVVVKVLFKLNIYFHEPKKSDLIIFDGESFKQLEKVVKDFDFFLLETRFSRVKSIYITKKILFRTFENYKKNLFSSYLLTIIDIINPKIVFTYIDNSHRFNEISKLRKNKYKFVALQNGARYEHKIMNKLKDKNKSCELSKFNIPYFLCFGDYEIKDYKTSKQSIKKFTKVGSLKLTNYLLSKKKNKTKKINDILLISDVYCWDSILNELNLPIAQGVIQLIKFTISFAIKNRLKIKIAVRSYKDNFQKENNFYKRYLSKNEYNFLIKNMFFRPTNYKTYEIMCKSKVVVGTMSTMLRENLIINGKTLACNFTKTEIFDFPIKGICYLKNNNYFIFEKRLKHILKIDKKKYIKLLNKKPTYLVRYDSERNTIDLVKEKLKFLSK